MNNVRLGSSTNGSTSTKYFEMILRNNNRSAHVSWLVSVLRLYEDNARGQMLDSRSNCWEVLFAARSLSYCKYCHCESRGCARMVVGSRRQRRKVSGSATSHSAISAYLRRDRCYDSYARSLGHKPPGRKPTLLERYMTLPEFWNVTNRSRRERLKFSKAMSRNRSTLWIRLNACQGKTSWTYESKLSARRHGREGIGYSAIGWQSCLLNRTIVYPRRGGDSAAQKVQHGTHPDR